MDYSTLKIIHLTGLALTFMGLAGILGVQLAGGAPLKKRLMFHAAQGIGLLILIITGFALGAKLGIHSPAPRWLQAKFVIWLLAGGSMALATRLSRYAGLLLVFFALLVCAAAWLAIDKPF
jgi:hypothetical protein